jgi:AraC-like DNA-binding protein
MTTTMTTADDTDRIGPPITPITRTRQSGYGLERNRRAVLPRVLRVALSSHYRRHPFTMRRVEYREYPPHAALGPYVRAYWSLCGSARESVPQPVLPDGATELVVHRERPFIRHTAMGPSERQASTLFVGQMQRPVVLQPDGAPEVVAVRFRPHGAFALLRVRQHELRDAIVDAEALALPWLRGAVRAAREATSVREGIGRLEAALLDRLRDASTIATDPRVDAALVLIDRARGDGRVDRWASQVGAGRRQLERLFRDQVGLTPKVYARVMRFQAMASSLADDPGASLAQASSDVGYFDQSHMIRDFLAFAGDTPTEFKTRLGALTRAMLIGTTFSGSCP